MTTSAARIGLDNLDVHVLVDRSGSMGMYKDTPTGQTRWQYASEYAFGLVQAMGQHDKDGIGLGVFNDGFEYKDGVTSDLVGDIWAKFSPSGGTVLAPALKHVLDIALAKSSDKHQLIVVVGDGQPADQKQVAETIVAATKRMTDDGQIAISFAQVGSDRDATAFLKYLDDSLVDKLGAKFDIVDTGPLADLCKMSTQDFVDKTFND